MNPPDVRPHRGDPGPGRRHVGQVEADGRCCIGRARRSSRRVYVLSTFRPFEADPGDSGLKDFTTWMGKTDADLTENAMIGWIDADLAYQGIKAAGPSFSRASVITATNKMTAYSADGIINPIDWTRQHESPTEGRRVARPSSRAGCCAVADQG
jgi:hypothetical protein